MIKFNIPNTYQLYDSSYGPEPPMEQIFVQVFDTLPSKYENEKNKYSLDVIEFLKEKEFVIFSENIFRHKRIERTHMLQTMINKSLNMIVALKRYHDRYENSFISLTLYYNRQLNDSIDEWLKEINIEQHISDVKISGIKLITMEHGMLDVEEYQIQQTEMNLEMNYGSEFLKVHDTIVNRLNKPNDKGIILFHGEPGTGKTSYIRHLAQLIKDKEVLFVPPSMAESLSEPGIIPFLLEHQNSILIIEDAERVIADREINGSSAAVSNVLNLTDGILGDCLNIQIIATFNMKREKIDQALLRKGRLIAEHKFSTLTVDETNRLLEYLNKKERVDKGLPLSDIYNIDEEVFKKENKTKIGFNS